MKKPVPPKNQHTERAKPSSGHDNSKLYRSGRVADSGRVTTRSEGGLTLLRWGKEKKSA